NKTTDGYVKILADAGSDRILGVHIICPQASEMIAEAAVIMEFGGSAEDLARTCHAHPTLAGAVMQTGLAVGKRAIHMVGATGARGAGRRSRLGIWQRPDEAARAEPPSPCWRRWFRAPAGAVCRALARRG